MSLPSPFHQQRWTGRQLLMLHRTTSTSKCQSRNLLICAQDRILLFLLSLRHLSTPSTPHVPVYQHHLSPFSGTPPFLILHYVCAASNSTNVGKSNYMNLTNLTKYCYEKRPFDKRKGVLKLIMIPTRNCEYLKIVFDIQRT